jgi:hypothetical protein
MPNITNTNPGVVDVSLQSYPPPPQQVAAPSSAPLLSSNGEVQFPAARPTVACPSTGKGLPAEARPDNESCARPLAVEVAPPSTGQGLPAEARPDSASCVGPLAIVVAQTTPPARDVFADIGLPGGLAKNVYIR